MIRAHAIAIVGAMSRPDALRHLLVASFAAGLFACGDDASSTTDTRQDDSSETLDTSPLEVDPDTLDPDTLADTAADTVDTIDALDALDTIDTSDTIDTADPTDTTTGDVGDTDTSEPGPALAVERFGARLWGPIIQMSKTGRLLWLGTRGNSDPLSGTLRGGLYRIDLDTGAVRHYEDELPREDFHRLDPSIPEGTFGPTPTAGVQAYDTRHLAVAHTGLLLIDGSSVTPFALAADDPADDPIVPVQLAIEPAGVWLTSNRGLLRLDPVTFEIEARLDGVDLELPDDAGGDFGRLAVDPATGAVYAAYMTSTGVTHVVRVARDGATRVLTPGADGLPSGRVGDLVWSATRGVVYVALGAWSAGQGGVIAWDGTDAREIVREGALAQAHTREIGAFGAQALALDDENAWLAVGGQVQSGIGGQTGGGLVVIDLAAETPRLVGFKTKTTPLFHWHTHHLVWDGKGRLYAAMSDLCSEIKLRNRGLFALRFDGAGEVHYERPLLSGVRAVGFGDDDVPWLGLRDDNGGMACDGYPIQTGFGSPRAGGSLALTPVVVNGSDGFGGISLDPGVTALDASRGGLALGTYRDGFFVGREADGRAEGFAANQALLGPSLFTEDVIHEPGDTVDALWIAGRTSHNPGDPPQLADRGPRGAALVTVRDGVIDRVLHYVRASEDADDIVGLPSGEVMDLHREPDGSVLAACAAERVDLPFDRMETPIFEVDGVPRMGGLARLDGTTVEVLAGPETLPDPRAVTRDAAGRLLVADAARGVWRQEGDAWAEVPLDDLPAGAIPQAIWAGGGDDLALATSAGLWVRLGGRVTLRDDVGFAWALAWRGDRLYAGTDVGLVVVRPSTTPATAFPAPAEASAPPFE